MVEIDERSLFGGRMILPERDVWKDGDVQVTFFFLVAGLRGGSARRVSEGVG